MMELDELRNTWSSLNERLKKQETLKENILKEMLQSKSGKALNRLINYAYFGIVLSLICIIPMVYTVTSIYFGVFKTSLFISVICMLLVTVSVGIYNVIHLHKIDFTKNVNDNIRLTQSYKIRVKKQIIPIYIIAAIILIMAIIASLLSPDMEAWRWVTLLVCLGIGIVGGVWEYKKMYKANVESILKSLDELKELEEE